MYIIRTERKEPVGKGQELLWSIPEETFWSPVTGIFSSARMAAKYKSAKEAEPTLDWLKDECPHIRLQVVPLK